MNLEEEVREALKELVDNYNELYRAAEKLYFAGHWVREDRITAEDVTLDKEDIKMWEALRDALKTKEGVNG
jgi:c-di-GMP-related signal transduction protein